MAAPHVDEAVASLDSARRALVLLGALLYPLSDERAALENADADGYLSAIAARMEGICGQSRAILEHSLKAVAGDGDEKKRRRRRRGAEQFPDVPEALRPKVERILGECEVPDAMAWVHRGGPSSRSPDTPLEEFVPFTARIAAAAVRLADLAADRVAPASERSAASPAASGSDDRERVTAVVSGTRRTAKRIALVLDVWDMHADTPTAMIGCPPPPGSTAGDPVPASGAPEEGRRSLGVAATLGGGSGSTATTARSSAARRSRTDTVWKSGGAIQRD